MIVDSQPLFVEALRGLLSRNFLPEQIFVCDSSNEAIHCIENHKIDLLILDIELKESSGMDLISMAISGGYTGRILVLTSKNYDTYSSVSRGLGAHGYVNKSEDIETITGAISGILKGYCVFKTGTTTDLSDITLSQREVSVLDYLSQGYTNKQISQLLSLSEKTVSTYKSRILKKYKTKSVIHVLNAVGES